MKIGYIKLKAIKGWKRSVTPLQKSQKSEYYGNDGKNLFNGMKTNFDVYFIKDSKFPYRFQNYETNDYVAMFKSIEDMLKYIKKLYFRFQLVKLEYIKEK